MERGLDFSTPRLYILDGGKALHAAVRRHAGEAAFIQRCQVHKKRNVVDHLPDEHKADVKKKLQNAYAMADYADAKRALERLHRELMDLNPSAARSLEEGMEETLTVHKSARAGPAPPDPVLHQRDRVRLLHRRNGLPERQTLADGRSDRALGWLRACWSPSGSSAKSSVIARFRCCCPRWPTPFPRNRLRKEPRSRSL